MRRAVLLVPLLIASAPVQAAIPDPVRAMIDAAIATGDAAKVAAVVEVAKTTNPADAEEIETLHASFRDTLTARAAKEKEQEVEAVRSAGLLDLWKGRAEIGGLRSTGNTDTLGLTGAVSLDRKGIAWQHKVTARADYQRSGGKISREKYFAAYEPRVDLNADLFVFGLAQFDSDRFQGYSARYAVSGGLGATVLDTDSVDLSVKAGPALRITRTTEGLEDTRLAGLVGLDFDWRITERLKLTQATNAVAETGGAALILIDSRSTTLNLLTGLEAKVSDRLSTRFSYAVDYASNPPAGKRTTDTISRFSLVYGF